MMREPSFSETLDWFDTATHPLPPEDEREDRFLVVVDCNASPTYVDIVDSVDDGGRWLACGGYRVVRWARLPKGAPKGPSARGAFAPDVGERAMTHLDRLVQAIRFYVPDGSMEPGDVELVDAQAVMQRAGLSQDQVRDLAPKLAKPLGLVRTSFRVSKDYPEGIIRLSFKGSP